jgi:hypothetical protein
MIHIKIADKKYNLPSSKEISIKRFIEFLNFADEEQPEFMRIAPDDEGYDPDDYNSFEALKYYCRELAFWTGAPLIDLIRTDATDVAGTWVLQQKQLHTPEDKEFHFVEIEGERYTLPERLMTNSTVEDFAEGNEYERQLEGVLHGEYEALPKIAAVLLRKLGEGFYDYDCEKRAELFAEKLTAYDAMQIGFFLQRRSEKSLTDFRIFTASQTLARLKQA